MRPSQIKPGTQLTIQMIGGSTKTAHFIKRIPAEGGRMAVNYLRFPEYAGLNGPDDDGTCEMSDYDLSRRGQHA